MRALGGLPMGDPIDNATRQCRIVLSAVAIVLTTLIVAVTAYSVYETHIKYAEQARLTAQGFVQTTECGRLVWVRK